VPDLNVHPEPADIYYQHRILPEGDLYLLVNNGENALTRDFSFRASGKAELWDPATGKTVQAPRAKSTKQGITTISLNLESRKALFILFVSKESKTALLM